MDQKWMAMLGAAGFVAMILASGHTIIFIEELREKRERRKREQDASPTPPPARH